MKLFLPLISGLLSIVLSLPGTLARQPTPEATDLATTIDNDTHLLFAVAEPHGDPHSRLGFAALCNKQTRDIKLIFFLRPLPLQ